MSLNVFAGKIWHAAFLGGIELVGNAFIFSIEKACFFARLRAYWSHGERHHPTGLAPPGIFNYSNQRIPQSACIREAAWLGAGVAGLSLADTLQAAAAPKLYPAKRNVKYNPKIVLTNKAWATGYNNFYEFTTSKEHVRFLVDKFKINPWQVEVSGLCDKPFKFDALDMAKKLGLEERVYRFRCVEAWSMIVPWTGTRFQNS